MSYYLDINFSGLDNFLSAIPAAINIARMPARMIQSLHFWQKQAQTTIFEHFKFFLKVDLAVKSTGRFDSKIYGLIGNFTVLAWNYSVLTKNERFSTENIRSIAQNIRSLSENIRSFPNCYESYRAKRPYIFKVWGPLIFAHRIFHAKGPYIINGRPYIFIRTV